MLPEIEERVKFLRGVQLFIDITPSDLVAVAERLKLRTFTAGNKIFSEGDITWRGFPLIPKSFMALKEKYEKYDARKKYGDILKELEHQKFKEPKECRCGEVLRGIITSRDCPLFGTKCTPLTPVGPCMVSREGSCNIEYRYK